MGGWVGEMGRGGVGWDTRAGSACGVVFLIGMKGGGREGREGEGMSGYVSGQRVNGSRCRE